MLYNKNQLCDIIKCKNFNNIRVYMCRPEFAHIKRITVSPKNYVWDFTDEDIKLMKSLIHRKRGFNYI